DHRLCARWKSSHGTKRRPQVRHRFGRGLPRRNSVHLRQQAHAGGRLYRPHRAQVLDGRRNKCGRKENQVVAQAVAIPADTALARVNPFLPAFTLWWREIVRFYRQPTRVVGVLVSPLLFWVVIGAGFGTSLQARATGQENYLNYFFPGALIMIVLFTSIFTMMSVIEDRNEGFLLSVMVAPVHRSSIVLGKVLGGTTLSAIQGGLFLVFAP